MIPRQWREVVPQNVQDMMLDYDRIVRHFEVVP